MEITDPRISSYLEGLKGGKDDIVVEMEEYALENDVPIAPDVLVEFQRILMESTGAERVLEVGAAIGYTTVQLAREGIEVVSLEIDPVMVEKTREYARRADVEDKITVMEGDASELISELSEKGDSFDAVFLDAMKEEYLDYLELGLPLIDEGDLVIADNLLWFGQVATGPDSEEYVESTRALQEFNQEFVNHPKLDATVLPFGDGTGFAVKK
ncbi:MAG: O-methyltransferase [Halobacteria archaeon]